MYLLETWASSKSVTRTVAHDRTVSEKRSEGVRLDRLLPTGRARPAETKPPAESFWMPVALWAVGSSYPLTASSLTVSVPLGERLSAGLCHSLFGGRADILNPAAMFVCNASNIPCVQYPWFRSRFKKNTECLFSFFSSKHIILSDLFVVMCDFTCKCYIFLLPDFY